jgi:hypothetical protein
MDWGVSIVVYNDPMNFDTEVYIPIYIVFFALHHYIFRPVIFMKQSFNSGYQ